MFVGLRQQKKEKFGILGLGFPHLIDMCQNYTPFIGYSKGVNLVIAIWYCVTNSLYTGVTFAAY
jgi:hypothetical protein